MKRIAADAAIQIPLTQNGYRGMLVAKCDNSNEYEHMTAIKTTKPAKQAFVESSSQFNLEATREPAATEAPWPMMPALPECEHPNA